MAAGNRSFPRGGGHLEACGEFLASRPALARRLVVNALILMAGLLLMLARTSPALASDNSNGQGKAQDHTSASAMTHRQDSPTAKSEQNIGGGGGSGGDGGGKAGSGGSGKAASGGQTSGAAAPAASVKSSAS